MHTTSRLLGILLLLGSLTSCGFYGSPFGSLAPGKLKYEQVKYPGYFDIGAGWARVSDTRSGDDDDAEGTMVSFKAYPFGRWYAEPLDDLVTGLRAQDRSMISILANHHTKKNMDIAVHGKAKPLPDDSKTAGQTLAANRTVNLEHSDRMLIELAAADKDLTHQQIKRLEALAVSTTEKKWHIVAERDKFWNRFAVFYGRSVGNFDSGGLESEVNAIGVAFDISPDMALQIGRAFYEADEGSGVIDSDSSIYFGVSLNLNSFKQFAAAIANLGN